MRLTVAGFGDGEHIPSHHTCDGTDERPTFTIEDAPRNARSLLIVVDDSDTRPIWTHWALLNIAPTVSRIGPDALPEGSLEGVTSWGSRGWRGPCPPSGTHHYAFRLFALDTMLSAEAGASPDALHAAYEKHIIESSVQNNPYTRR